MPFIGVGSSIPPKAEQAVGAFTAASCVIGKSHLSKLLDTLLGRLLGYQVLTHSRAVLSFLACPWSTKHGHTGPWFLTGTRYPNYLREAVGVPGPRHPTIKRASPRTIAICARGETCYVEVFVSATMTKMLKNMCRATVGP